MQITKPHRLAMVAVGALVLAMATAGTIAAVGGRSSSAAAGQPSLLGTSPAATAAPAPSPSRQPTSKRPASAKPARPSASPAALLLADGTYPAYVRTVDVENATVTLDVIQVFEGDDAVAAAIEDGMSPDEAQYEWIHVRNQNPRLRTLPVAPDVKITFLGECEAPDRDAGLTELAQRITPFTKTFYYDITVVDGAIHQIMQRVAIAAC